MKTIDEIMTTSPVVPVMVIEQLEHAVPLARALCKGGLRVLEITLRTPVALQAINDIKSAVPEAIVGAGTVLSADDLKASIEAGSEFLVSPGTTTSLVDAALAQDVPLLPGVATPSEAMVLAERGITRLKFFPAEAAGGVPMLKSIGGPLPHLTLCPTGGINLSNAASYLALPNVACIGGSWMAPASLTREQNWAEIEALAAEAAAIVV